MNINIPATKFTHAVNAAFNLKGEYAIIIGSHVWLHTWKCGFSKHQREA